MSAETSAAVAAWAGVVTALGTLLLVLMGWLAYRAAKDSWRAATAANDQAKADSIEQSRPYVFVEWLPSIGTTNCLDFRVTNSGKTSATNLKMTCDEWPDPLDDVATQLKRMMEAPRTLPPGCSIRNWWWIRVQDGGTLTNKSGEPCDPHQAGMGDRAAVTVTYDGPDRKGYTETFNFVFQDFGLIPIPEEGHSVAGKPTLRNWYHLGQVAVRKLGELNR